MRLVDESAAESYLRESGRIGAGEKVRVRELGGGVSNMVLLVERAGGEDFVLKQARAQLRTSQPWFSSVERVWREADVLRTCTRLLEKARAADPRRPLALAAQTPHILFEDRANYLLAMTAAPRPNVVWKAELLAGRTDPAIAAACGTLLATLHGESWLDEQVQSQLGDRTLFDELRVDPYYRTLARARPETQDAAAQVIASLDAYPRSLVHADFSPKNLLVYRGGLMMVDFETGHYGDPAFDLGFFLSHLVLKACLKIPDHARYLELARAFGRSYDAFLSSKIPPAELADLWARGVRNFALCAWARLDGKSPVEYLSDEGRRELIRAVCRRVLAGEANDWAAMLELVRQAFDEASRRE